MLNINFLVNEEYLARKMISRNDMPTEFADYLWDKYRDSYLALIHDILNNTINQNILKELQQQDFFKKYMNDAKNNLTRIQTNWNKNQANINNFLKTIMKIDLDLNVTAFIFHPDINTGMNIGNNCFLWGHHKGLTDENYDLVFLVHEALHSYFANGNLNHAIIENICDVELSRFLNKSINHYPYHSFTQSQHVKIYPFWNLYLNRTKEEIKADQQYTKINYDIEKYENEREILTKLNINEFIEFLKEKSSKIEFETYYEII